MVAEKYRLVDESEYWEMDDEEEEPEDRPTDVPPSE
jgi:hypothetical protein